MGPHKVKSDNYNLDTYLDYFPVKHRKAKRKTPKNVSYKMAIVSEEHKQFHIGKLYVGTTSNIIPENWSDCRASFASSDDEQKYLLLDFNSTSVIVHPEPNVEFLKDLITSKIFSFNVNISDGSVNFDLYFVTLPFPRFYKKIGAAVQALFSTIFGVASEEFGENINRKKSSNDEIAKLYKAIKTFRNLSLGSEVIQPDKLRPLLRPYQQEAVRWMLHREKRNMQPEKEVIHPLYTELTLPSNLKIYYNKYTGFIEVNKPIVKVSSAGGILADEMGLGKTVEVLACILLNPKNSQSSTSEEVTSVNVNSKSPTIEKTHKKRRIIEDEEPNNLEVYQPKKIKVPDEWIKGNSKKSEVRQALEAWYHNSLSEVSKKPKPDKLTVQCICGGQSKKNNVKCRDCGKIQHAYCLGYSREFGEYRCPQCWMSQPLLESKATLIVSPVSLRTQWCKEISKHICGNFRVLQYDGVSVQHIYPEQLLNYDVVVTTYNVLKSELRLTETEREICLRHQRKYSVPGNPLTRIKWWRLCLDEAQTVEGPTSMVSAMAQKLSAHHRWAVTGTPISKEISDIYGLIDYLQIEPYNDPAAWKHSLFEPYINGQVEPMQKFLSEVLWRSSKAEVVDQINIPKQTVEEHWLEFSAVEQHFYKCEHQSSRDAFLDKVRHFSPDAPLHSVDRSSLNKVLAPLLSLRQVCTYPNSVRTRYLATKKQVNTMQDLLEALIEKNTTQSEEFLRVILSSFNGLAGIYLLLQNPEEAIQQYRNVLQFYTRFTEEEKLLKLNVDKLQIIHTMHNLAEILDVFPNNTAKTLRDESLRKCCADLEQKYIGKFITQSMCALQDSLLISNSVEKLQNSFVAEPGSWYSELFNWLVIHDFMKEFTNKIRSAHEIAGVECTLDLNYERNILHAVANWDQTIGNLRETSIDIVNDLYTHCPEDEFQIVIAQELVQKATDCHLRPQKKKKSNAKCPVCVANEHLKSYEFKLFSMKKRTTTFEEMSLKGSWKSTTEELVLKSMLSVGKAKNADKDVLKDGDIHMNILEILKKEFKEIRKLWTFLDQQICAQDELDMCKIRLQLKDPNDEKEPKKSVNQILKNLATTLDNKLETIHVLDEHELDYQKSILHGEEAHKRALLEKNLGIRSYLETLRQQQYEGQKPDPCPICKNTLEHHWTIVPCGHSYCMDCIQLLIGQIRSEYLQCSVCRAQHFVREISYVKQGEEKNPLDNAKIKGNYSTKVEAVIELIIELKTRDECVKILVFSSWNSVLVHLRNALNNNDVSTELVTTSNLEKPIERFKDPEKNTTVLLLPIHLGSKGLNLIEATHVILIEPLLNSGDELQAIGRVHRIGQTKPTVVHKFFIRDTIEESIQKATSVNTKNWEKNKVTLRQLIDLFTTNEFNGENSTQAETNSLTLM